MNAPGPLYALWPPVPALPRAWDVLLRGTRRPIVLTDAQRRITWVNDAFTQLSGYTLDEALGCSPGALLQCDATDAGTVRRMRAALDAGQGFHGVLMNQARDGRRYWLDLEIHPFGPEGGPIEGFVALNLDLTAERVLEQRLADQSRRLQALFDRSPIGLALCDVGRASIVECNAAMARITGQSTSDVLLELPLHLPGVDTPMVHDSWLEAARQSPQFGPLESSIPNHSGRWADVVVSGVTLREGEQGRMAWLMIQDVTERKRAERELLAAAQCDRLTGLPNRSRLTAQLETLLTRCRANEGFGFAVLFLDFDRFKLLNDSLGHDAGDELLISIAQRLLGATADAQATLADPDGATPNESDGWLVARFGGDEFVILAPGMTSAVSAASFAEVVIGHLGAPHQIKGIEIQSSASIGIAFGNAQTRDAAALLRDADTAMYVAKRRGRRNYVFFDEAMRDQLTRSLLIEEGLGHAQVRGELQLLFQPIVDLQTGMPVSAEALLRWNHPTLGAVSPAEFVPIAEETGQIVDLGRWVLFESCAAWARWRRDQPQHAPRSISVNLSRIQMGDGLRLLATVRSVLEATAMPAECLQLEITEREVMNDPDAARELVRALRHMGVRIAMDDFGTGTSSLSCLREYAFDTVKIDKSFVTDVCADAQVMAVAHATVSVIENLGLTSVAEGIETASEVAALQSMGCRYGQGYLFGRPMDEQTLQQLFVDAGNGRLPGRAADGTDAI